MTRLSTYLLPTVKEAPADAEAVSHRLMVRAGLIRQLGAGMWTWLPAGWRSHQKAEQIVRQEIDAIGGQEMLMPVLQPAELWQRSGRYAITELFKLEDRRDEEGLDRSYTLHIQAYDRIFDRAGLEWYRVESDVGMMGGTAAHEYMAPCAAGENEVALSDGGYAANMEIATGTAQPVDGLPEPLDAPEPVETPGATTIEHVSSLLGVPAGALIKAIPVDVEGRCPVLTLMRRDHRLNEIK